MPIAALDIDRTTLRPIHGEPLINALILDDNKFDRRRLRRMSRDIGMPIFLDEVGSIDALREVLDEDNFDVIFLDYRLAEGDGLQALTIVQNHPAHANCPTIMLAGGDDPDIAVQALRMGCSDYLSKSQLTADGLRRAVVAAIEKADMAASSLRRKTEMAAQLSQTIMAQFRVSLQPELAGVVRNIRSVRSSLDDTALNLPQELEAIEARCVGLWSLLSKLGTPKPDEV